MTERGVTAEDIQGDVAKLPDDIRIVLVHRMGMAQMAASSLSVKETAKALGLTPKTVEERFDRGLEMLRKKYLKRPTTRLGRARQALGLTVAA